MFTLTVEASAALLSVLSFYLIWLLCPVLCPPWAALLRKLG